MAEQAIASSSFFQTDSQRFQSQTKIATQTQSLPRSYRDLLSPTQATPSIEDLNTLKSTLSGYESQLKTLKNSKAKDPLNDSAFSVAISAVESKISGLRAKITSQAVAGKGTRNLLKLPISPRRRSDSPYSLK
jgi:hypothetical protein